MIRIFIIFISFILIVQIPFHAEATVNIPEKSELSLKLLPVQQSIDNIDYSDEHRRLSDLTIQNTEGPWDYCMYLQYEYCEQYLLSQADDIYVVRVNPLEYDYHRVVIVVNDAGIVVQEPSRG